jgi:adenylosuccinate lyase
VIRIISEDLNLHSLKAISPIDGRHRLMTEPLSDWFSEFAFFKYMIKLEIEYLVALSELEEFSAVRTLTMEEKSLLRDIVKNFSLKDAQIIQNIDRFGYKDMKAINQDFKSCEYFIKMKMENTSLQDLQEFIHFGLTSEDAKNVSRYYMLNGTLHCYFIPAMVQLLDLLKEIAENEKSTAMLGRTHGEPATPTTFGKEMANYLERLRKELVFLKNFKLPAKCNGAVGNHAAQHFADEKVDWIKFTEDFLTNLGFEANLLSTQVESRDGLTRIFSCLISINNILRDLTGDIWIYVMNGHLKTKKVAHEVSSSTMPHKVSPWRMEVAEGCTKQAVAKFNGFIQEMQVSRLQRDMSDHEFQWGIGEGVAHSYLAVLHILEEFERLEINRERMFSELKDFGSILTEAVQALLRKEGYAQPYELLKDFSRGKHCTVQELHDFIDGLDIREETKLKLKSLQPENYIGLSKELTELAIKRWEEFKEEYEEPLPKIKKVFLDSEIKTFEIVEKLKQMEIEVVDELDKIVDGKGILYIGKMNEHFQEARKKGLICINYDPERKTQAEYNIIDLSELPDLINSFGGD